MLKLLRMLLTAAALGAAVAFTSIPLWVAGLLAVVFGMLIGTTAGSGWRR